MNGISARTDSLSHNTATCALHTTQEQHFGTPFSLPNDHANSFQPCSSQTSSPALPRSKPITTKEECLAFIKEDFNRKFQESFDRAFRKSFMASKNPIGQKPVISDLSAPNEAKKASLAMQEHVMSEKAVILDISSAKETMLLSNLCPTKNIDEQRTRAVQGLAIEKYQDVEYHSVEEQDAASCRPEVKYDIIQIKVPRSFMFDKVCFASNLSNSQSDHIFPINTCISGAILSNSERLIEEGNLLVNNDILSDSVNQCIVKIRKANTSNILAFKFSSSSLPKLLSTWIACGHSGIKTRKPRFGNNIKVDSTITVNSKVSRKRNTSKGIAEWIDERSESFVFLALKPFMPKNRLKKIKYTFDLTLCDELFDSLLENNFIRLVGHKVMPSHQDLEKRIYCKWHNSFDHSTDTCNTFRLVIQSAINKGRLRFSEVQIHEHLTPIGPDGKKLLNRLSQADSSKNKELVVEDDSKPPSEERIITQETSVNILGGDNPIKIAEETSNAGGQQMTPHHAPDQLSSKGSKPDPPMTKLVRPFFKSVRPVSTEKLKTQEFSEIHMCTTKESKGRKKHKGKRPKLTFKELLAKYVKERDVKSACRPNDVKQSWSPPNCKYGGWNWREKEVPTAVPYPYFGLPMPMSHGPSSTGFHLYSSWRLDGSCAHAPSYYGPYNQRCTAQRKQMFERPYIKDHFQRNNRSRAQEKKKVVKQVYRVKRDGRKDKSSDLSSSDKKLNNVVKISATSGKKMKQSVANMSSAKSEQKKLKVLNIKEELPWSKIEVKPIYPIGSSSWTRKKLQSLSAEELKKKNMAWVPKGSIQVPFKDEAHVKDAKVAKEKNKQDKRQPIRQSAYVMESISRDDVPGLLVNLGHAGDVHALTGSLPGESFYGLC
ncbi:hypothetical protein EJB05_56855, partial [Eragrostis curvula]